MSAFPKDVIKAVPPTAAPSMRPSRWECWWNHFDWLCHRGFMPIATADGNVRLFLAMASVPSPTVALLVGTDLTPDNARLLAQRLLDTANAVQCEEHPQ